MNKIKKLICKLFNLEPKYDRKVVYGITEGEYLHLTNRLKEAYNEACARQKPESKKPSGYMKGLMEAMDILASVEPHIVGGA